MTQRSVLRFIGILCTIYAAFVLYLLIFQDRLIFFPVQITEERWQQVAEELNADYVTIQADTLGTHLQGWFIGKEHTTPRPTVIFFGGNAMQLHHFIYTIEPLRNAGVNLLLVDYRGYGLSEGEPGTDLMRADAEKIFDAATSHPLVDPERITVWGWSLGTGIATHLASVRPVEKLILFAPFTSTTALAQRSFPFVPVSLILKHKLDNLALAPTLSQPALIVQGENDTEISVDHSQRVAEAWGTDAELLIVPGRGHGDLLAEDEVWARLVTFVTKG